MNRPFHTPMRALIKCQWQFPKSVSDYPVVEFGATNYAAVPDSDVLTEPKEEDLKPEWLGYKESFPHRSLKASQYVTYSGYVACHVMAPFDITPLVNIIVSVWEEDEDYRIVRTDISKLLIARAQVGYISPTEQRNEYIDLLAGINEAPRSDTFM